jgi:hypothetical protein
LQNPHGRTGQLGDHPREHCGPLSLGQIHTGHKDDGAGEQFHPIT